MKLMLSDDPKFAARLAPRTPYNLPELKHQVSLAALTTTKRVFEDFKFTQGCVFWCGDCRSPILTVVRAIVVPRQHNSWKQVIVTSAEERDDLAPFLWTLD